MFKFFVILLLATLAPTSSLAADPQLMKPVETYVETGTDVDASAYNEVISATVLTAAALLVYNSTPVAVKVATGAAASEVDLPIYIGALQWGYINIPIPLGTRLAVRALTSDAASGYVTITLLQ